MGFECGFSTLKKYGKTKFEELPAILKYYNWYTNKWYSRNGIDTFEKYITKYEHEDLVIPKQSILTYYATKCESPNGELERTLDFWCSIGLNIDSYVASKLPRINDNIFGPIDDAFISEALTWVEAELAKNVLLPVQVIRSYRLNPDGHKVFYNSTGIEVTDESGNRKFIDTNEIIYIPSEGFDNDLNWLLNSFKDTLLTMKDIDKKKNFIWYWRSY